MSDTNQLQQRLVVILHAQVCQQRAQGNPQHVCILPLCGIMRALLRHIGQCLLGDSCDIPGCPITRKIQEHWLLCRDVNCTLCEPIRLPYRAHLAYAFPDAFKAGSSQALPGQAASNPSPAFTPGNVPESTGRGSSSSPTGAGRTTDPSPSPVDMARALQSSQQPGGSLYAVRPTAPSLYAVGQGMSYPPSSLQVGGRYPSLSAEGGPSSLRVNGYALPSNTKPAGSPPFSEDISPASSPSLDEAKSYTPSPEPFRGHPPPTVEQENTHLQPSPEQADTYPARSEQAAMYGAHSVQPASVYQTASVAGDSDQAKAYREYVNHAQAWLNSVYGGQPGQAGINLGTQLYQAATYQADTEEVDSD